MQEAYWAHHVHAPNKSLNGHGRHRRKETEAWWGESEDWSTWLEEKGQEGSQTSSPPRKQQQQHQQHQQQTAAHYRSRPGAETFAQDTECSASELKASLDRLRSHLKALPGMRDCTKEVQHDLRHELSVAEATDGTLLVFMSEVERRAHTIFPPEFFHIGPDGDAIISEGYLVLDFRPSAGLAVQGIDRLARSWWSLAKSSPKYSTLVFVATLAGGLEEEFEGAFATLYDEEVLRSPAPIMFAAMRSASAHALHATGPYENMSGGSTSSRKDPVCAFDRAEEGLIKDIADFLRGRSREVQELASKFASRFNDSVRANPASPYSLDGKNDGSFKKWLLSRGFESSPVFEGNKSVFSLPKSGALPPFSPWKLQ